MSPSIRNWTDEQDAVAYDTFVKITEQFGAVRAASVMHGVMEMDSSFAEIEIKAWILRYEDEHDVVPHAPSHPIDRDYASEYDLYMGLRS